MHVIHNNNKLILYNMHGVYTNGNVIQVRATPHTRSW
jgi:hypothetical protein